jgi:hypothetical protein
MTTLIVVVTIHGGWCFPMSQQQQRQEGRVILFDDIDVDAKRGNSS